MLTQALATTSHACTPARTRTKGPVATLVDTLQVARPTSFSSTPRFWNTLYHEFQHLVQCHMACNRNSAADSRRIAKEAVKAKLGGRCVNIGTGGAHTTPAVLAFMRDCFQCNVTDGFGATEAGGIAWDGTVGSNVKTKVLDVVDMGYTSKDTPYPRGELCVSTNALAGGYLNDQLATDAAFFTDEDGKRWYRTGDIVEVRGPATIVMVDRLRALFKLAHGEYISPQKVEQILETLPLVTNCWVTGRAAAECPVAVVQIDKRAALELLASGETSPEHRARHDSGACVDAEADVHADSGIIGGSGGSSGGFKAVLTESMCGAGSVLERAVHASITAVSSDSIRPFEMPRGIIVELHPWTVATGLVTGTQKLRRPNLEKKYATAITELYERLEGKQQTSLEGNVQELQGNQEGRAEGAGSRSGDDSAAQKIQLAKLAIQHLQIEALAVDFNGSNASSGDKSSTTTTGSGDAGAVAGAVGHGVKGEGLRQLMLQPLEALLLDSLSAMSFMSAVNRQFESKLHVSVLLEEGATLQFVLDRLLEQQKQQNSGEPGVDFVQETRLADGLGSFAPGSAAVDEDAGAATGGGDQTRCIHQVVLTGATGFVGAFLLHELMALTPSRFKIVCLVRAENDSSAMHRVKEALRQRKLDAHHHLLDRRGVVVLAADLSKAFLGLDAAAFAALGAETDLIVHCGARVHSILPYSRLKAPNVLGTVELLKLASMSAVSAKGAFFCHVSTVGVLPSVLIAPMLEGSNVPHDHLRHANGYSQSKWVAEVMVRRAFDRGLRGFVVRPATVFAAAGQGCAGANNDTDFVIRSIRGMVQLGAAPTLPRSVECDLTPVDSLAHAIVGMCATSSNQRNVRGKVLNLAAPDRVAMADLIDWVGEYVKQQRGIGAAALFERLPFHQWQARLLDPAAPSTPLHPLKHFFSGRGYPAALQVSKVEANAALAASESNLSIANVDSRLVRLCLAALDADGLLPGPGLIF